jgi:hypothetical protein
VTHRVSLGIAALFLLAGCAGQQAVSNPEDYVEIDNPAFTMSPGAPPTIMVPRRYVESGVPRGGEAIKQGIAALREPGTTQAAPQVSAVPPAPAVPAVAPVAAAAVVVPPQPVAASVVAAPAPAPVPVLNRILVVDLGKTALAGRFSALLRNAAAGIMLDPGKATTALRYAPVASQAERSILTVKLQEDFGANLVVYLSGGEAILSGTVLVAEVLEGQGGALVKRVDVVLPAFAVGDAAAREAALATALRQLAQEVKDVAALVPWYGTVVTVEGDRVYLSAGKESGITIGRVLHVYRPGKVLDKLGFAPGRKVGIIQVTGYVGTDGAFGIGKQGEKAQVGDLLGLE